MPRRPYWKGHMRLSLVTFPVQLHAAVDTHEKISLHQIHKPTGERIRYQKVVPELGPVEADEIVKGYEYERHRYVLLENEELEALRLESTHVIDLVQFVDAHEIDAMYFERPYYVVPEEGFGAEAFGVVRDALKASRKLALGQIVLSSRERIGAVRACGRGMILETLRYGNELKELDDFFAEIKQRPSDDEQRSLAEELIKRKSRPFDPDRFKDHYETALRELVESKLAGRAPEAPPEDEDRGKVIDLADALRRSVGMREGDAAKPKSRPKAPATAKSTQPAAKPAPKSRSRAKAKSA